MTWLWLTGLLRRRPIRLLGTAVGVAVAVAMLASLGAFLARSQSTMTERAVRGVAVDWQVEVVRGAMDADVAEVVAATPGVVDSAQVDLARTTGFSAVTGATTQMTGPGVVLGLPDGYGTVFLGEIRSLVGAESGVLLAQQTAANLHAAPGDTVSIGRQGMAPATVTVAGVIDLPQANSLFQKVGAPPSAQPIAPPDNVLILPAAQWRAVFDPLGAVRPDLVTTQFHLRLDHTLPRDPAGAYTAVTTAARNLEARSAGTALVGDNLGATLDAARHDAAYAGVLFLFLGLPGAVLAGVLTATMAASGSERRRSEQALLRSRGASARQLLTLAGAEAAFVGVVGAGLGIVSAAVLARMVFGTGDFGGSPTAVVAWPLGAAAVGMLIAAVSVVMPVRRDLRNHTIARDRQVVTAFAYPRWAGYGADAVLLVLAAIVYRATSSAGYQLVLAPEGVPTISVSYWAFVGPVLLWTGSALFMWRLADLMFGAGRPLLRRLLRPLTGELSGTVAATLSRQRRTLVRTIVLLGVTVAFAVSTATFNATYRQQAEADAQLTNGADVTVQLPQGVESPAGTLSSIAAVPGVAAVEPMQHRFAYIGSDLQDLYGVNPATIRRVTALQDSYFPGARAGDLMATLATAPDSILVSAETVHDFQLQVGDPLVLRLVDAATRQPKAVTFRYIGVVTEFPTAPKDSFLVANAEYIAAQTGSASAETYLVDVAGRDTAVVTERMRQLFGTSATVTDIANVRDTVGSSLTSVDLAGLTAVELSFALVLAVGAGGLVFALGYAERRRTHGILTVVGARPAHLRALIFSEITVLGLSGMAGGAAIGATLSVMLVKVLSGVFDPPPDVIAVPWTYFAVLSGVTVAALAVVGEVQVRLARRPAIPMLREL
ncbi:FtsX-like permease family protein [Mycolicibacterium arenosum]|uniref:FtsX-like permease family protein n=1 Tax=Mycolicibacterium arenosum TaxID=2952157 RepID=A0ABT1MBB4_9MYCO|nr:FtsX-like permease family protein [Mycolicibacterium sp. CAU 1645]MCP9276466.1 FtsX-like permease family protein [Mycolicibacterium sp. CAU 1645]